MSHELDMSTGEPAVFVAGEPAWHKLGRVIEKATTSSEAIRLAGLDWKVEQWPLNATDPSTWRSVKVSEHVANVRQDTRAVLGVVGRNYKPFQNIDAFDFLDSIVGDRLAIYETAGSLRGGRKIWMLVRVPREYRAGRDDLIKPFLLLVNSHDGSTTLRMLATTIRVVCQNTLNLALQEAGSEGLSIRHHSGLDERVASSAARLSVPSKNFFATTSPRSLRILPRVRWNRPW